MKSKLVVDGVLFFLTAVIVLSHRKSLAQRMPDAMENLRLLSSASRDQTAGHRLAATSQDFSDFKKFINTFETLWPSKVMEAGGNVEIPENSSACAEDLTEWRRAIFRKDVWALSCEYDG
jgi:hypothetical protein